MAVPSGSSAGRTKVSVLVAIVVAAVLLGVPAAASADSIDSALAHGWSGPGCTSATSLSQRIHSSLAANPDVPSVQVAVFSPRCGLFRDVAGLRDIASNAPAEPSTRYLIASVSKTMTASAVWTLIQRHQIDVNDTIDHWFSPSELFGVHQVTVNDLLTGNTPYQSYDNTPQWPVQFPDQAQQLSEQQVLGFIDDYGPVSLSDKLLDPLNGDYFILSVLLERATHKPFDKLMSELIFNRVGMQDSEVVPGLMPTDAQHATPYEGDAPLSVNGSQVLGSVAVASTATDMVRFAHANFINDKILDDHTLQTIVGPGPLTPTYLAQPTFALFDINRFTNPTVTDVSLAIPNWGPGLMLLNDFFGDGQLLIGMIGNGYGASSAVAWDPTSDNVIAVASNSRESILYDLAVMHSMLTNAETP
jgi:CubicO group peptidase (beta-lactamase class C family)